MTVPSNSSEYRIGFLIIGGERSISFHATWRNPSLCYNWAREVSLIPEIHKSVLKCNCCNVTVNDVIHYQNCFMGVTFGDFLRVSQGLK